MRIDMAQLLLLLVVVRHKVKLAISILKDKFCSQRQQSPLRSAFCKRGQLVVVRHKLSLSSKKD